MRSYSVTLNLIQLLAWIAATWIAATVVVIVVMEYVEDRGSPTPPHINVIGYSTNMATGDASLDIINEGELPTTLLSARIEQQAFLENSQTGTYNCQGTESSSSDGRSFPVQIEEQDVVRIVFELSEDCSQETIAIYRAKYYAILEFAGLPTLRQQIWPNVILR